MDGSRWAAVGRGTGRRWRAAVIAFGALAAGTGLAGCGGDPNGFNEADVTFAADMTQHHAQTVQLVNLPLRHRVPSRDTAWTDPVRTQRFTELQAFARLLRAWGHKVPDTGLEHSDEGKHVSLDPRIPGVLNEQQMHALERGSDAAFARSWLREVIRHEEGAVRMAAAEVADGQNAQAVAMARRDRAAHAALVAELQRLARS